MCVTLRLFLLGVFVPYYTPIVGVMDRFKAEYRNLAALRWSRKSVPRLSDQ